MEATHCVKIARIQSFSGPRFPAFGLNTDRFGFVILELYTKMLLTKQIAGFFKLEYLLKY